MSDAIPMHTYSRPTWLGGEVDSETTDTSSRIGDQGTSAWSCRWLDINHGLPGATKTPKGARSGGRDLAGGDVGEGVISAVAATAPR